MRTLSHIHTCAGRPKRVSVGFDLVLVRLSSSFSEYPWDISTKSNTTTETTPLLLVPCPFDKLIRCKFLKCVKVHHRGDTTGLRKLLSPLSGASVDKILSFPVRFTICTIANLLDFAFLLALVLANVVCKCTNGIKDSLWNIMYHIN